MNHGQTRTAYTCRAQDEWILKLGRPGQPAANLAEAQLIAKNASLFPSLYAQGVAHSWKRHERVAKEETTFLLVEKLTVLEDAIGDSEPSRQYHLLLQAALYVALLAKAGVRASDCKLKNLGIRSSGEVLALDFATYVLAPNTLGAKGIRSLLSNSRKHIEGAIVDAVERVWQSARTLDSFIESASGSPAPPRAPPVLRCPWPGAPLVAAAEEPLVAAACQASCQCVGCQGCHGCTTGVSGGNGVCGANLSRFKRGKKLRLCTWCLNAMDKDEAVAAAPPDLTQPAEARMLGGSVASRSAAVGGDEHPAGIDAVSGHASLRDDAQLRDTLMFIDGGYVTPFRDHMRSRPSCSSASALWRRLVWPPCWPHASALAAWGATDSRPGFPVEMA